MPLTTVNGNRFHFRLEGDPSRRPVVLVHPIGADLGLWDRLVPLLTPWAWVLRYDLRGHGGSGTTLGDFTLAQMSADLLAVASAAGMERFSVVGISLGALTAIDAAVRAPERVQRLAVCSVAPRLPAPPGGWDGRAQGVRASGMAPLGQPMVERMFSASFRATQDPVIETMRTTLLRMDPEGYASACAVLRDADVSEALRAVRQQALVISGEDDALTPPAVGRAMAGAIPEGRHAVLPGGHFPPIERADEFAVLLRSAWAG